MSDKTNNQKRDEGLSLLKIIYGIAIVLGFRELSASAYDFWFVKVSWQPGGEFEPLTVPIVLFQIMLIMFGLRFFWGVENIRRFIIASEKAPRDVIYSIYLAFSVGILLIQASLIYFMARIHSKIVKEMSVEGLTISLLVCGVGIILINAIWLTVLQRRTSWRFPENFWVANNFICAVASMLVVWIVGLTQLDANEYWSVALLCVVLVVNSVTDYSRAWEYYFGLQDDGVITPVEPPPR